MPPAIVTPRSPIYHLSGTSHARHSHPCLPYVSTSIALTLPIWFALCTTTHLVYQHMALAHSPSLLLIPSSSCLPVYTIPLAYNMSCLRHASCIHHASCYTIPLAFAYTMLSAYVMRAILHGIPPPLTPPSSTPPSHLLMAILFS
jgi:hypothetical protein